MNFSEAVSNKLSDAITSELNYNQDKKDIITYAIETALLFFAGTLFLIIFGFSLNALVPTLIAAFFGSSLRRLSGGAHFDTPLKCLGFGTIVYSTIGVLAKIITPKDLISMQLLFFILFVSLIIVSWLAPVDSKAKPIHSMSFMYKLKASSIIFLIIAFLVVAFVRNPLISVSAVLGIFYQSITLLPIFNREGGD